MERSRPLHHGKKRSILEGRGKKKGGRKNYKMTWEGGSGFFTCESVPPPKGEEKGRGKKGGRRSTGEGKSRCARPGMRAEKNKQFFHIYLSSAGEEEKGSKSHWRAGKRERKRREPGRHLSQQHTEGRSFSVVDACSVRRGKREGKAGSRRRKRRGGGEDGWG